jgi:hypothetical protein
VCVRILFDSVRVCERKRVLRLVGPFFIILLQEYRRERERAGTFTCVRSLSLTREYASCVAYMACEVKKAVQPRVKRHHLVSCVCANRQSHDRAIKGDKTDPSSCCRCLTIRGTAFVGETGCVSL